MGQLEHLLTKHATWPSTQAYLDTARGLVNKPAATHALSAGIAGLGLLALLSDRKRDRKEPEPNWLAMVEELANTPLSDLRGALAARAKDLGELSAADLALALAPGGMR